MYHFYQTFSKKLTFPAKTLRISERNFCREAVQGAKASNENSTTGRTWNSPKLFLWKTYTPVADKSEPCALFNKIESVIFSISFKINMPTVCFGKKKFK